MTMHTDASEQNRLEPAEQHSTAAFPSHDSRVSRFLSPGKLTVTVCVYVLFMSVWVLPGTLGFLLKTRQ